MFSWPWFAFTMWAVSGAMAAIAWGQGWAKKEGESLPLAAYPLLTIYGMLTGPALWVLVAAQEVVAAIKEKADQNITGKQRKPSEIRRERKLAEDLHGNPAYCDGYRHALDWVLDPEIPPMNEG